MKKTKGQIEFEELSYRYMIAKDKLNGCQSEFYFRYENGWVVGKGYHNMRLKEFKDIVERLENRASKVD